MNRRTFGGAVAGIIGGILLPSWHGFRQKKVIDLAPFCDDDHWPSRRYDLTKPFAQGGLVYATDGRVCVRTTLADAPELSDEVRLPKVQILPWSGGDKWQPWPKRKLWTDGIESTCPECQGKGGFGNVRACGNCDGSGTISFGEPDFDYESNCRSCHGTGSAYDQPCGYCNANGHTDKPAIQAIGDICVAGHYDSKVRALGDVEYLKVGEDGWGPVLFRGDGFEGLLMGLNLEYRKLRRHA